MSSDVTMFPDAEATVIAWTAGKLGVGVRMRTQVPNPRPASGCVRVTRTGGVRLNLVTDNAQLTFQCWHSDERAASELCARTRALVDAMAGETVNGVWVRAVREVGGPANFPDPESTSPRYQFTTGVLLKGTAMT